MVAARKTYPICSDHYFPEQQDCNSVQPERIPSGIELGLSCALGTALSACSIHPALAAATLGLMLWTGRWVSRRLIRPPPKAPSARKITWLCIICGLSWLSHELAATSWENNRYGERLSKREQKFSGSVKGRIADLPILRQKMFPGGTADSKYIDFLLETQHPEQFYRVWLEIKGDKRPAGLKPGAFVKVQGKIAPQYHEKTHNRNKAIAGTIRALPGSLTFYHEQSRQPAPGLSLRWKVTQLLNRFYAGKELGLFSALITGEKRSLDQDLKLLFVETGAAHFLAISGLHVGLVMLFAMKIPFPWRGETCLRLLLLGLFVLLSGGNTPVLRAAMMIGLHLSLQAAGRLPRALDTFGWTLLLLLILDPLSINEPGFQLSFVATFAILAWTCVKAKGTRERRLMMIPSRSGGAFSKLALCFSSYVRTSLWVAVISTAATAPLIAMYFHRVHPISPVVSVCLFPLIALSLVLGLSSILLGFISIEVGLLVANAASVFARMLIELLVLLQSIPGQSLSVPPPGILACIVFYLLLGAGLLKKTRGPALLLSFIVLPASIILSLSSSDKNGPVLTLLDSGAGSAALLELPANKSIFLLDACGRTPAESRRLARSILKSGHRRIDGIVLSHPHSDHAGALPLLTKTFDVGEIICSEHFEREDYGAELLWAARKTGIPVRTVERSQELQLPGPELVSLRIIYPAGTEELPLRRQPNEMSLSFFIEADGKRVLCLGDLEENGLARLFETNEDLTSEILILPHHGRTNRLYGTLLKKVSPGTVVVSGDGRGQAEETLRKIELSGINCYATWRGGGIRIMWKADSLLTCYVDR